MRKGALVVMLVAMLRVAFVPNANAVMRCFVFPDARIIDPGPGQPSYCGGSGPGSPHCFEIVVVP